MVRLHSVEIRSTRRLGNEFFSDPKSSIVVPYVFAAASVCVPQKGRTAATPSATAAACAAACGADNYVERKPDDDQPRAIHNDHMGSSKRHQCSDRTGGWFS